MINDIANVNTSQLADRWWTLVIRGAAAILFGVLTFVAPGISLVTLVLLWGGYALIDGVFNLVTAVRGARAGRSWGWLTFEGIVSILAGVLTFVWPGITALALLLVIGAWAVLTGIAEIAAAIRLRKQISGEWLLAASGVLSIVFGVLMFMRPSAGALAVVWLIGVYALVFGATLVGLGFRLHKWRRQSSDRAVPTAGAPTQA